MGVDNSTYRAQIGSFCGGINRIRENLKNFNEDKRNTDFIFNILPPCIAVLNNLPDIPEIILWCSNNGMQLSQKA